MGFALPNPLKKLPWNVKKEQERNERKLRMDGAKLFRELGISEDATFEEIQDATEKALMKLDKDDLKSRIKIEVTKDKIMQLRLNQRLGGLLSQTKEAAANTYLKEDAEELRKNSNKKKSWEPPAWTRGLIVKPTEQWRDNCIIFFGILATLGFFMPTASNGLQFFSFIMSFGFMAQRGAPAGDPSVGMGRGNVGKHTFLALGFALLTYAFSAAFGSVLIRSIPGIGDNIIADSIQTIFVVTCMGIATAFLHPYTKDTGKKGKKQRKGSVYGKGED